MSPGPALGLAEDVRAAAVEEAAVLDDDWVLGAVSVAKVEDGGLVVVDCAGADTVNDSASPEVSCEKDGAGRINERSSNAGENCIANSGHRQPRRGLRVAMAWAECVEAEGEGSGL